MGSCPGGSGRGGLVPRSQGSSGSFPSRTSSASIPTSQAPFSSQFHSSASHSMVKLPLPAETMFWNYRHAILVLPPSRALRFTLWATQTPLRSGPMTTIGSFTLRSLFSHGAGIDLTRHCFAWNAELTPFPTQDAYSANINSFYQSIQSPLTSLLKYPMSNNGRQ